MTRAILLFLFACSGPRKWTKLDVGLEVGFSGAVIVDAWQSSHSAIHECTESNPILGPCGDRVPLSVYVPAIMILHAAISHAIPTGRYRTLFQAMTLGLEIGIIYGNYILGYGP
jgi:hypothetical protein